MANENFGELLRKTQTPATGDSTPATGDSTPATPPAGETPPPLRPRTFNRPPMRGDSTTPPPPPDEPQHFTRRWPLPGGGEVRASRPGAPLAPGETRIGDPDDTPDHLRGGRIVRGPDRRFLPDMHMGEKARRVWDKIVANKGEIAAIGLGVAGKYIALRTGISPADIGNVIKFATGFLGGQAGAGLAGVAEQYYHRKRAETHDDEIARRLEKYQKAASVIRFISQKASLVSLGASIESLGEVGYQSFEHHLLHEQPDTNQVAATPTIKPETPTPTETPHATAPSTIDHPTSTRVPVAGTPIPTLSPTPHENPTATAPHPPTETPTATPTQKIETPTPTATATHTPTSTPTPVPTATPIPTPGGNSTPLEVHGTSAGAHAASTIIEHAAQSSGNGSDKPIDTSPVTDPDSGHQEPGSGHQPTAPTQTTGGIHPGQIEPGDTDTGSTPPELHHLELTSQYGHTISGTVGTDLQFDGKEWHLVENGEKNFHILAEQAGLPSDFTIDHEKYSVVLQNAVELWAKGELTPEDHPLEYALFHAANGTESEWPTIIHQAPQIMGNVQKQDFFIHPQAPVLPENHASIPLVAQHAGEDTPAQSTQQAVDKINQIHSTSDTNATDQTLPADTTVTPISTASDNPGGGISPLADGTPTFPTDTHAGLPEFHTGPIDHITAQTGIMVNGELGNTEHPLTYGEVTWDLQNPAKETEAYNAFITQTGLPIDQQTFHHALEQLLNDAAYTWAKGELDDTSPKGLLFHWFNGTESMQAYFEQNPSAVRESFEKLAEQYPNLVSLPEQPPYTSTPTTAQAPNNIVPFPGAQANVIPFPSRGTPDDKIAA